jgi:hypothetical protein
MRLLSVALVLVWFGCGKADTTPMDSGVTVVDAGAPPVCLPDALDASVPDSGVDAGTDFSCRGRLALVGGQSQFVITGKTTKAGLQRTVLSGVQVELVSLDGTVLASTVSGDGGLYSLSYAANCQQVDGEVRATSPEVDAGYSVSYTVPEAPWSYDRTNLELVMFDPSARGLAAALANVTLAQGTAALGVTVIDCAGDPVEGAVVSVPGDAGIVRYVGAVGLPTTTLSATGPTGDLVIFNVPGSQVEVTATRGGQVIGQRVVPVHADAISGTFLAP